MKNLNKKKVLISWKYIFPELKNFDKFFKREKIDYKNFINSEMYYSRAISIPCFLAFLKKNKIM